MIEDHVQEERDRMFARARRTRGLDLTKLGEALEQRRYELVAGHPA